MSAIERENGFEEFKEVSPLFAVVSAFDIQHVYLCNAGHHVIANPETRNAILPGAKEETVFAFNQMVDVIARDVEFGDKSERIANLVFMKTKATSARRSMWSLQPIVTETETETTAIEDEVKKYQQFFEDSAWSPSVFDCIKRDFSIDVGTDVAKLTDRAEIKEQTRQFRTDQERRKQQQACREVCGLGAAVLGLYLLVKNRGRLLDRITPGAD